MSQEQTKKEALFNEIKGSLFEYLMGRRLAQLAGQEIQFVQSLDKNYLNVLSQQDRMVRQFYPEMLKFLNQVSETSTQKLVEYLGEIPLSPQLRGKFSNSHLAGEIYEADLILTSSRGMIPLSLKLNKKNAFVNTKSGGVKSFFQLYFSFLSPDIQQRFNSLVDREFSRMSFELHALNDMEFTGDYSSWVKAGKSELPGELSDEERFILKSYYARIAFEMHQILVEAKRSHPDELIKSLPALLGFSSDDIVQLVCFHDFKSDGEEKIFIHSFEELRPSLSLAEILPFAETSSVDIRMGDLVLQIRVKPMNKFTTTAIKLNCSVKFKQT